ncbi:hypothetical protein BH09BAC2_BH09BAC2_22590 [soil metagenome]
MKLTKKFSPVLFFVIATTAFMSCRKETPITVQDPMAVEGRIKNQTPPTPTDTTGTTTTTTPDLSVNFNNLVNTTYGFTQATLDFKNPVYWNSYNTQSYNGMLKANLASYTVGPSGGAMSKFDVTDAAAYQLQFDMMFDNNFDFSYGGKVGFGFLVGNGYTGGTPGWDGLGGSFRLMWYKNTSTGANFLKPYAYYKDQPGTYGNDFGKAYPATGSIQKGVWYTVKMYIKSNTGSNTDGRMQLVINGTTVVDQAIRWTTDDTKRLTNTISFENFRGGSETYWQSTTEGTILFDNISWKAL